MVVRIRLIPLRHDAVLVDLIVDDAWREPQTAGGGGHVAVVALKRLHDEFALKRTHHRVEVRLSIRKAALGFAPASSLEGGREVVAVDGVVGRGEHCAFDAILQFADIARPVVGPSSC